MSFLQNFGQFDGRVQFQARTNGGVVSLVHDALWLSIPEDGRGGSEGGTVLPGFRIPPSVTKAVHLRLSFVEATLPKPKPLDQHDSTISYLRGTDADQWVRSVPVYRAVEYSNLFPGVDLEVAVEAGELRLSVSAGCDDRLHGIRLSVEGPLFLTLNNSSGDDHTRILYAGTELGWHRIPLIHCQPPLARAVEIEQLDARHFQVASPFLRWTKT